MKPKIKDVSILLLTILALAVAAVLFGRSRLVTAFDSETSRRVIAPAPTLSADEVDQKELYSEEIQALFLAKEKELLKPGWLHIVYRTALRTDIDRGYLTDGVAFPNEYIIEDWYLLDDESYVVKAVTFMRDLDGNFLQKNILIDGTWINTTLDDRISVGKFKPSIDGGYLSMAKAADTVLDKLESQMEDRAVVKYEIKTDYPGSDKNTQQIIVKLYFSMNGDLIKSETVLRNVDGVEVVEDTTEILLMENVQEPSKDVVEYYSEVEK